MLRLLCCIVFALIVHTGAPLKAKLVSKPLVLKSDSTQVNVHHLDSAAISTYGKSPEFQYKDDAQSEPSWYTHFWNWFWNLFKPVKFARHNFSPFLTFLMYFFQYLFIALGLAAIVFLVLKLVGIDMLHVFRRKPVSAGIPYSESLENIHEIDFDDELERSIALRDYRLAVRLLYLKCLKQLSDADLIKWQPDKTNSTYANELNNRQQKEAFKKLTLQFEYIWYGDFSIDSSAFKNINALFSDFKQGLI